MPSEPQPENAPVAPISPSNGGTNATEDKAKPTSPTAEGEDTEMKGIEGDTEAQPHLQEQTQEEKEGGETLATEPMDEDAPAETGPEAGRAQVMESHGDTHTKDQAQEPETKEEHVEKKPPPVPGPRAATFNNLLASTLSHTLQTISYRNFAACFPTMAEKIPNQLQEAHGRMAGRLGELAKKEMDDILERRNVVENLNSLETLIADARRRKARAVAGDPVPIPPNQHTPSEILSAHLAPTLAAQQSQLNAKLQTTQSQNATLFATVLAQRKEIEEMLKGLENLVSDLDTAVGGLDKALGDEERAGGDEERISIADMAKEVEMDLAAHDEW